MTTGHVAIHTRERVSERARAHDPWGFREPRFQTNSAFEISWSNYWEPRATTPLTVGRSVGPEASPSHSLYRKALSTRHARRAVACCAAARRGAALRYGYALCCAVPCRRCGTVCRAILSRVAWLVVSFLYSFVGKSAASLVFKRRQRERERERIGRGREMEREEWRHGKGRTEAKGKRRGRLAGGAARGVAEEAEWWLGGKAGDGGTEESPVRAVRQ